MQLERYGVREMGYLRILLFVENVKNTLNFIVLLAMKSTKTILHHHVAPLHFASAKFFLFVKLHFQLNDKN